MNPYLNYYVTQAGNGISYYQGNRFQRGHGWFGRLFSNTILPALKFLGRHALTAGVNVAQDALQGQNVKQSLKQRLVEQGVTAGEQALDRAKIYAQTGRGLKRKRHRTRSRSKLRKQKGSVTHTKRKRSRKRRKSSKKLTLF